MVLTSCEFFDLSPLTIPILFLSVVAFEFRDFDDSHLPDLDLAFLRSPPVIYFLRDFFLLFFLEPTPSR